MAEITSASCGDFYHFPRLPKELRDQVWAHAAMNPRILDVQTVPTEHDPRQYFFSFIPVPAILQTCHESRAHALKFYVKAFAIGTEPRYIWTNFEVDTIRIGQVDLAQVSEEERGCFRRLIVDLLDDGEWFYGYSYPRYYQVMKRLRSFVVSSGRSLSDWGPLIFEIRDDFKEWKGRADDESWTDIDVRFVDIASSQELWYQNYDEIMGDVGAASHHVESRRNERIRMRENPRGRGRGRGATRGHLSK